MCIHGPDCANPYVLMHAPIRNLLAISILLAALGGCSGPSGGPSQVAVTKDQRISLISKAPLRPGEKQKLIQRVQQGGLKGQ
jgi:hypothetical protein